MAVSVRHRGWLNSQDRGVLAAVYNGAQPGARVIGANTAIDGILIGTPVSPALAVDSLILSNMVASGDILIAANTGGNSLAWLGVDSSASLMTLYGLGVSAIEIGTNLVINEGSADRDFRVETDGIQYALYADGGKNALVLGSNTDTSSADQLITVSRAARTATANTNYFDLAMAPAGAVTVPAGTTAVVATVSIAEPNITSTGTTTRAATLYIASQPTEGGTANAAILFGAAANIAATTSLTFNEDSEDVDFRFESNGMAYAIYSDGGKDALVLGSNTDTSSVDQLITVSRAARTATANTNYYDFVIAPAGAVTVPAGTTAVVATATFNEPNITATGTVTDAATVYIVAAPTEGGTGNYALLIAAGAAALKGGAYFGATVTTAALVSQATSGSGTTTHYIGNQTITTSSDSRVKTNIQEWAGKAMDLLRRAEPLKEFTYNLPGGGPQDSGYGPNARGRYLGWIAQETRKWAPWVVNAGAGGDCPLCMAGKPCDQHSFFGVEYDHLVPLAIQAIKELDSRLIGLESRRARKPGLAGGYSQ